MTLTQEDIETIRSIVDERAGRTEAAVAKLEGRMFDEMEKISRKVDCLADAQQVMRDGQTRVEVKVAILEDSRASQGERIGKIESDVTVLKTQRATEGSVKKGVTSWAQVVTPLLWGAIMGGLVWIFKGGMP